MVIGLCSAEAVPGLFRGNNVRTAIPMSSRRDPLVKSKFLNECSHGFQMDVSDHKTLKHHKHISWAYVFPFWQSGSRACNSQTRFEESRVAPCTQVLLMGIALTIGLIP